MRKPKRYEMLKLTCSKCEQIDADLQGAMTTHDAGRWVMWDDYAAIAADRTKWINLSVEHEKEVAELQGKVAALSAEKQDTLMVMAKLHMEYRSLQAEHERLRSASFVTAVPSEEYEKLKAENERLRKDIMEISNAAKMVSEIGIKVADELTMLKEQNERLLKAGDEMRNWIISEGYDLHCVDAWLAAKEGGAK